MNQRVIRITKARITATPTASFMKQRVIRFSKAPAVTIVMPPMKRRFIRGISTPPQRGHAPGVMKKNLSGKIKMTGFWQLPHSLVVERPDAVILRLAALLERCAASEWDWEFTRSGAMFRFASVVDKIMAALHA